MLISPVLSRLLLLQNSQDLLKKFVVRTLCCVSLSPAPPERSGKRRPLSPGNPALEKRESSLSVVLIVNVKCLVSYQFTLHLRKKNCLL